MKKLVNICAALMAVTMVRAAFAGTDATNSKYKKDDAKNAETFFVEEKDCKFNGGFKFEKGKFTYQAAGINNVSIVENSYKFEDNGNGMGYEVAFKVIDDKSQKRNVEIYFTENSNVVYLNSSVGEGDDERNIMGSASN